MSSHDYKSAQRPNPDELLVALADYTRNYRVDSSQAYETAKYCLMDTLACGFQALKYPACTKLLGPVVPGATMPGGSRVPGTSYELDPVMGAFSIGAMVRWLDFNDTWLAAEWGHPSDNLGAILAVSDYLSRRAILLGEKPLTVRDVLTAMIKAHEIQGVLALENSFNRVGLDHVLLVRVASTAVATEMLGGSLEQIVNALSNAWIDGGALRTYRHAPNTGSRKSWAAGDATSRAVRHALFAIKGEMGYPSALSAKTWGFQDVLFKSKPLTLAQPLGSYVMENVLFKISFPAEFHAQTAVECAMTLHPQVKDRLASIDRIVIETQEPGVRIIDKTGPLANPADRDHCIQYMVAVPLIFGRLTAADYEDVIAHDPRIDMLRDKMTVKENTVFTQEYYERDKRHIGNALHIFFNDGTKVEQRVDFPIGHRKRRAEGMPVLVRKFEASVAAHYPGKQSEAIRQMFARADFEQMPVNEFMAQLVANEAVDTLVLDGPAWKKRLDDGAAEMGVQLDESQVNVLWRYAHMLRERNEHVNLTSIVSPEGILTLHMLDSLSVASHLGDAGTVVDVGTGGGFPGIPLAVAFPGKNFTLIDGTQKKIRFVNEGIEALDIRNATALAARAETLPKGSLFDVVLARAVGPLADLVHNAGKLVAPNGRLLAMKGRLPEEEISGLPRTWRAEVTRLRVPGLDAERHLVSLSRVSKADAAKGKPPAR